jgi:salicylate hydroxylase
MRVAIVGGGIGGLAAALALQGPGREITIYEQAEALGDVGAGVQLSPNAVRALRALEVAEALRPHVVAPDAIELRRARDDRLLIRSPLGASIARAGAPYWHARRSDLQRVLADAVRARGAATLELSAEAAPGSIDADLLVGADGVRSAVRAHLLGADAPRYTGALAWRGTVPLSALSAAEHPPVAAVRVGPGRHFVSYRVGGEAVNFVGVVSRPDPAGEDWEQAGDHAALARDFAGWPAPVQALIAACEAPRRWALLDRDPAPRWTDGRIVLLGDAAHPVPPHLAQGAALALEDAVVLGRALALAPISEALRSYEAARRPRCARVLAASRRQGRLLQLGGPTAALAHLGLRTGGTIAPGLLVRSLGWLYDYDAATAPAPL